MVDRDLTERTFSLTAAYALPRVHMILPEMLRPRRVVALYLMTTFLVACNGDALLTPSVPDQATVVAGADLAEAGTQFFPLEFDLIVPAGMSADVRTTGEVAGQLVQQYEDADGRHSVFGLGAASLVRDPTRDMWASGSVTVRDGSQCWRTRSVDSYYGTRFALIDPSYGVTDHSRDWERVRVVLAVGPNGDVSPYLVKRYFIYYDQGARVVLDTRKLWGYFALVGDGDVSRSLVRCP